MPVLYKLITKMIVHHLKPVLLHGLHPRQNGFVPMRNIMDNISNALIGIEYAKYT